MKVVKGALKLYDWIQGIVVIVLLAMLTLVVLWATWGLSSELIWQLIEWLAGGPGVDRAWAVDLLEEFNVLRDVFGAFLLILIGLELMKTIVMYLDEHVLHVEVVLVVAVIAIARHAIELDLAETDPLTMIGMGAMVLALAVGLYIFRKTATDPGKTMSNTE